MIFKLTRFGNEMLTPQSSEQRDLVDGVGHLRRLDRHSEVRAPPDTRDGPGLPPEV
jgi:hypothetical protein